MPDDRFTNEPLDVSTLPQLADEAFTGVHPRYLRVRLVGRSIFGVLVLTGAAVLAVAVKDGVVATVVMSIAILYVAALMALAVAEVRRLGYQLREHDLSLRSGVIQHRVASLPYSRVQHINIGRGPLERLFGLASLAVSSAGPNIGIPGLTEAEAQRIKVFITERADVQEDDQPPTNAGLLDELAPSPPPPVTPRQAPPATPEQALPYPSPPSSSSPPGHQPPGSLPPHLDG